MRLPAEVLRGKTQEDVKILLEQARSAKTLLEEYRKVLTAEIERSILKEEEDDLLSCPNLTAKVTALAARRKALRFALDMMTP